MLRISKAVQGGFALIFLLVMISAVVRGFIKYSPAAIAFTVVCGMVFTAGVILIYGFLKKKSVRLTRKQIDKIFIVIAAAVLVLQLISAFYLKFTPVSVLDMLTGRQGIFALPGIKATFIIIFLKDIWIIL